MNSQTITLDVREDIRNGREPFSKIMGAVAGLRPDDRLLLVAPFEPAPLFAVLAKRGFNHAARQTDGGDWEVLFTRDGVGVQAPACPPDTLKRELQRVDEVVDVDARGLEPPQPMVKILEAVEALPSNGALRARTDRRPMHLYAQLEARGFTGQTEEQNDGSFITHIRRR
jgi:uncharacterized protein (DUF2249 family)